MQACAAGGAAVAATLGLRALPAAAQDQSRMGVVVKIGSIPWSNAMEVGIEARAALLS